MLRCSPIVTILIRWLRHRWIDFFGRYRSSDGISFQVGCSLTDPQKRLMTVSNRTLCIAFQLSDSLSATDDSQEDVVIPASVANKRKRRRNAHLKDKDGNWLVPRIHLPRIPKSDIRRSFGIMFTNVYNSCNYEYMTSFVDKFISNDCHYSNIRQGEGLIPASIRHPLIVTIVLLCIYN